MKNFLIEYDGTNITLYIGEGSYVCMEAYLDYKDGTFEEWEYHAVFPETGMIFFRFDPKEERFVFSNGAFVENEIMSISKELEDKAHEAYIELLKRAKNDPTYSGKIESLLDDDLKKLWDKL